MNSRAIGRLAAAGMVVVGLLVGGAASAQEAQPDPRWFAWIGCWQPVGAEIAAAAEEVPTLCVVPVPGSAGVEVATVVGGSVVERERLDATGAPVAVDREGCSGTATAGWSSDGHRLFRRAEYACPGGLVRRVDGLMALSPTGEWLDVQHLSTAGEGGVRVLRYRPVPRPEAVPEDLLAAVEGHALSASTARMAASTNVGTADVVEASGRVEAEAVEAWLVERGQGFALELDAERLVGLADAGVEPGVIDLVVALSYPDRFAIDRASGEAELREEDGTLRPQPRRGVWDGWGTGYGGGFYPGYYGGRYGGYGYGGYGGYYAPPVIVVRDGDDGDVDRREGRAVKGRGYTRSRGDGGSSSSPSARPSSDRGSSGSSGASGSSGSSGSGRSSTGRTAKPRPPS